MIWWSSSLHTCIRVKGTPWQENVTQYRQEILNRSCQASVKFLPSWMATSGLLSSRTTQPNIAHLHMPVGINPHSKAGPLLAAGSLWYMLLQNVPTHCLESSRGQNSTKKCGNNLMPEPARRRSPHVPALLRLLAQEQPWGWQQRFSLFLSQTAYTLHFGHRASFLETFAAKGVGNAAMKLLLIHSQCVVLCWVSTALPSSHKQQW